ncbi:chloride channel protein [Gemella cuniculi]
MFQTPIAAIFFIFEITRKKMRITKEIIFEFGIFLVSAYFSTKLSCYLGLEKFFVKIDFNFSDITFATITKLLIVEIVFILIGMFFVICQKYLKKIVLNNTTIIWMFLILFILISILTKFKYSSLGINLINTSLYKPAEIVYYDFILKLILTALCTAVGFSGGEVTPLFAIGASLGVVISLIFSLPTMIVVALGYCLVFASATKTYLTPIFLSLEVFGFKLMLIIIFSAVLLYLINKKYSIYSN